MLLLLVVVVLSSGSSFLALLLQAKWDTQQVQLIAASRNPVRVSLFQFFSAISPHDKPFSHQFSGSQSPEEEEKLKQTQIDTSRKTLRWVSLFLSCCCNFSPNRPHKKDTNFPTTFGSNLCPIACPRGTIFYLNNFHGTLAAQLRQENTEIHPDFCTFSDFCYDGQRRGRANNGGHLAFCEPVCVCVSTPNKKNRSLLLSRTQCGRKTNCGSRSRTRAVCLFSLARRRVYLHTSVTFARTNGLRTAVVKNRLLRDYSGTVDVLGSARAAFESVTAKINLNKKKLYRGGQ